MLKRLFDLCVGGVAAMVLALPIAVVASEDAGFFEHGGVDWAAIEKAWQKNERRQELADPAGGRIEGRQGDAGHGGRQGERQVDQGVDEALAGELVAHQHPGHDAAEDDVDGGGDQRGTPHHRGCT